MNCQIFSIEYLLKSQPINEYLYEFIPGHVTVRHPDRGEVPQL